MPTYAYACADCGHRFDIVQSFSDDSLTVCPECSGTLRKQFSAVGVVFKGSGFYRTDSRSGGSSSTASSSSTSSTPAGESSGSSSSGTTDSSSSSGTKSESGTSGSSGSAASSTGPKSKVPASSTAS
ncbi:MAG: FmdB family transcriptional regulator [Tetrasphaera jenkinsii]|uniref:Putative regulatory protein, FmdB family n=1 Tax=Nostocoides jenkinsii Ben 74 TaxID=1193518 RepID=A0A077MBR1_9MICO|nr:FmdB family transcriptional regulator [Tetrasphaera jenkinsii]CCI54044.1 putative regulatory protein, FmdB family [Tetrasphaera jenkinsii Ben 74]